MEMTTIRLTFTPDATAASSLAPVARRSKPKRVRLITNAMVTPTTIAKIDSVQIDPARASKISQPAKVLESGNGVVRRPCPY